MPTRKRPLTYTVEVSRYQMQLIHLALEYAKSVPGKWVPDAYAEMELLAQMSAFEELDKIAALSPGQPTVHGWCY